jgi:Uma2 family endonuclease
MATPQRLLVPETEPKFTSEDILLLSHDEGKQYEVIEGELFVSRSPTFEHQFTCAALCRHLLEWSEQSQLGTVAVNPGLVFADDDDVSPDVVWISYERLPNALDEARHFRLAPELVIEVLSPGKANEDRDRKAKLKLYSRRAVQEYWIVDWIGRQVEIYRRSRLRLRHVSTLNAQEKLSSPLLPGFASPVAALFFTGPPKKK